jgi:hypothetical protein
MSVSFASEENKTLIMVYKPIAKIPYIQKGPDNSGVYFDMMKLAVEKIGYNLKVLRVPKARGYAMLKNGKADLYASGEFKSYRSKFLYYFPNGLYRDEEFVCLTSHEVPNLEKIPDINKHKLTWFLERGSSWPHHAKKIKVKYRELKTATIDIALEFITSKRPAMFLISKEEIDNYVGTSDEHKRNFNKFKTHSNCGYSKHKKLNVGFSKYSKYYKDTVNEDFSANEKASVENSPVKPLKGSVAYQLENTFKDLIESGVIDQILKKYESN